MGTFDQLLKKLRSQQNPKPKEEDTSGIRVAVEKLITEFMKQFNSSDNYTHEQIFELFRRWARENRKDLFGPNEYLAATIQNSYKDRQLGKRKSWLHIGIWGVKIAGVGVRFTASASRQRVDGHRDILIVVSDPNRK